MGDSHAAVSPSYPLTVGGQPGFVLLVSCASPDTMGGLFCYDGTELETIDRLSSAGLLLHEDQLLRLLFTQVAPDFGAEILFYDRLGVTRYLRIDDAHSPHYVDWDGENYVLLSTWKNGLIWVSPSGKVTRRWHLPGENDSWHLNCVHAHEGELYLTAFGEFHRYREWSEKQKEPHGILFKQSTGEKIVTGLACPHNPRFLDGGWVVCCSSLHQLVKIDPATNRMTRTAQLAGWTRGLAVSDQFVFVGESCGRHVMAGTARASVAILDRQSWEVLGRVAVPSGEISDLAIVPASLVEGLRRGFRTNPRRVLEQDQYAMFHEAGVTPARIWATSDPLDPADCRVRVQAAVPSNIGADAVIECGCTISNQGSAFLVSVPPHPVHISYRWLDGDTRARTGQVEGLRSRLTFSLAPGSERAYRFMLRAPARPGRYVLTVTLVQEGVAWFDDVDASNAYSQEVSVEPAPEQSASR
jgi:hypothetical protein